jgi:hypothetical protein
VEAELWATAHGLDLSEIIIMRRNDKYDKCGWLGTQTSEQGHVSCVVIAKRDGNVISELARVWVGIEADGTRHVEVVDYIYSVEAL